MSLSIYTKGDYEEFQALRQRKNKANLPGFGRKSKAGNPKRVELGLFEKTKPISKSRFSRSSMKKVAKKDETMRILAQIWLFLALKSSYLAQQDGFG